MLGIEPLFTSETKVSSLSAPCLDLFSLVRALMVNTLINVGEALNACVGRWSLPHRHSEQKETDPMVDKKQ